MQKNWLSGNISRVIALSREGLSLFPGHQFELTFELSQALIESGDHRQAADLLREADEKGFWCSPEFLPETPVFEDFRTAWTDQSGTDSPVAEIHGTGDGFTGHHRRVFPGGIVAWNLLLEETFRPSRLFLFCPGEFSYSRDEMRRIASRGVQIDVFSGSDDHFAPFHRKLFTDLTEANVEVNLDVIDGLGHSFPDDLGGRLAKLVDG